jgi:hypothetical protein
MNKENKHNCRTASVDSEPKSDYQFNEVVEDEKGELILHTPCAGGNSYLEVYVRYCPFCGYKVKKSK